MKDYRIVPTIDLSGDKRFLVYKTVDGRTVTLISYGTWEAALNAGHDWLKT